jgi:hypothetical protein
MHPTIERLKSAARALLPFASRPRVLTASAFALLCAAAAVAAQQLPPISSPPVTPEQRRRRDILLDTTRPAEPSLKRPDTVGLPARERRTYDAGRDATYLNVPVTLEAHKVIKEKKGALRFEGRELTLIFQLAYRGRQTYDLVSAYLLVESTAARGGRLSDAARLEIKADPYEYAYERADYQTEAITPVNAPAQQLSREVAAFRLPTEDLPQIAGAGRIVVKLGPETFNVASSQLSDLRRTLAAGADN